MFRIQIKNRADFAGSSGCLDALQIVEAGLNAIDTEAVIAASVVLSEDGARLQIKDFAVDLRTIQRIRVIGFGKASCDAAVALEKILREKITDGIVIDTKQVQCEFITSFVGTHPLPSEQNVAASGKMVDLIKGVRSDDLAIVIVSGGGSALLCWPEEECAQGRKLYTEFLAAGGTIGELNTVRKHLSLVKGGGLAKMLYPATVVGLVFCDVPGGKVEDVASGPTFRDETTSADAQKILDKYGLTGFTLTETPKEEIYFEKVRNILLVSSDDALAAMYHEAEKLGYAAKIFSSKMYGTAEETVKNLKSLAGRRTAVLGGGEIKVNVTGTPGAGGRCSHLALTALGRMHEGDVFVAVASDGVDNSDAAGVMIDGGTAAHARSIDLDPEDYLVQFDSYNFFKQAGGLLFTGPTGANVSDLMLWITK